MVVPDNLIIAAGIKTPKVVRDTISNIYFQTALMELKIILLVTVILIVKCPGQQICNCDPLLATNINYFWAQICSLANYLMDFTDG